MTSTTWTQNAGMDSGTGSDTVSTYAEAAQAAAEAAAASQASAAASVLGAAEQASASSGSASVAEAAANAAAASASSAETFANSASIATTQASIATTAAETATTQASIATTAAETTTTQAGIATTAAETATTQAGIATTAAANAALFDGPKFDSIEEMAAWDGFEDGDVAVINLTGERFPYDADSTATADGALVVNATGMGVGRLVSKATDFSLPQDILLDQRTFDDGTILSSQGVRVIARDAVQPLQNAGGQYLEFLPFNQGSNLVATGPGEVNTISDINAVASDGVTYAGEYIKTVFNLDGADAYQLLASMYIATPTINNPDGATWQDAPALFIQGQPKDPLDQSGSTSFGLFIFAGHNRIRDHLVVGNFDFSDDVLTANGGTGTDWTLTVRNEGVAQPNMFRVIEPTKSGTSDQADPGFPMLRMQPFDGQGAYFEVRTGGDIVMTQMGGGAWEDANKSRVTSYILGVDSNGFLTETQKVKVGVGNIDVALSSGATISPRGPIETILLNGTGDPSTYTLPSGFDGQELILKASQSSATLSHTVNGSFQFDPAQFPDFNTPSISMLNFESVHLIFRGNGTNRWVVVGRTKR